MWCNREMHGRLPTRGDSSDVTSLCAKLLQENDTPLDFISSDDIENRICLNSWGQLMPVCSVVGGFLSQEVVKAVSAVGVPMFNVFVFSLEDGMGRTFATTAPVITSPLVSSKPEENGGETVCCLESEDTERGKKRQRVEEIL